MVGFSVGLGSFASGVTQGMQLGTQIKGALDQRKMRGIAKDGSAEATAAREADIAANIQTTANPDGSQAYTVGGQQYASIDEAKTKASGQVGTVMDYYKKTTMPKLIKGYMDIGEPDKAQQLQTWMETDEANGITRDWARAARMALLGDNKAAMRGFGKLYERLEPGAKYVGMEEMTEPIYDEETGKDGKVTKKQVGTRPTGVRLKLKSADGEDVSHDFSGTEDLFQTAMLTLSPDKFVGRAFAEVDKAQASRAAAAKDAREFSQDVQLEKLKAVTADARDQRQHERSIIRSDREFGQTVQRDASQHGYRLDEATTELQMRAALKVSEDTGEKPEDVRKSLETITKRLAETDMQFSKLSPEAQTERAMSVLRGQRSAARGVIADTGQGAPPKGIPRLY